MNNKKGLKTLIFYILFLAVIITGEVKCIIKAVRCNWKPVGAAEVIYTASACTGLGCIVGYFNIKDE